MPLSDMRRDYHHDALDVRTMNPDPFAQFRDWFAMASECGLCEPNAMTLATASRDGMPSARMVLLKQLDERGFIFFSHYTSRKGQELQANPRAALVFWWEPIERQVRIEGTTEQIDPKESDAYFQSRPLGSRIGAAASPQSEVIADRTVLEQRAEALRQNHPDGNVPRPASWGGIRVIPTVFEFWQGRPDRLHDRIRYRQDGERWVMERLGA